MGAPGMRAGRLAYVDGLRALAALYVLICHIDQTPWWMAPIPVAWLHWPNSFFGAGQDAVAAFIVLSGYSLTLPVARAGWRINGGALGFYKRRARRIAPPYYCAMALSLVMVGTLIGGKTPAVWGQAVPITWVDIAQHVALVQDFTARSTINFVFWSIAVECQIYLLFPALVWLWRRYSPLFSVGVCLMGAFLLLVAARMSGINGLYAAGGSQFLPIYVGLFALGMFAATLTVRPSPRWRAIQAWRVWDALAAVALALLVTVAYDWPFYLLDSVVGALAVGLLLAAARPVEAGTVDRAGLAGWRNPIRAALSWRPLVWIGGFSYSLYLIHAPLLQTFWQYGVRPLGLSVTASYLIELLAGAPLIVLAAWGFWWLCERPFLNRATSVAPAPLQLPEKALARS